jgi:hypothetical protein
MGVALSSEDIRIYIEQASVAVMVCPGRLFPVSAQTLGPERDVSWFSSVPPDTATVLAAGNLFFLCC